MGVGVNYPHSPQRSLSPELRTPFLAETLPEKPPAASTSRGAARSLAPQRQFSPIVRISGPPEFPVGCRKFAARAEILHVASDLPPISRRRLTRLNCLIPDLVFGQNLHTTAEREVENAAPPESRNPDVRMPQFAWGKSQICR